MNSISEEDMIGNILQLALPQAKNIKIVRSLTEDDNRHFTSNIKHLDIEYVQDGKKTRNFFVLKVPVTGPSYELFNQLNIFKREITMYKEVLPRINALLHSPIAPRLYYTTDSKIMVFEDVSADGYQSGENHPQFNLDQSSANFQTIAAFHAASRKIYESEPHFYADLLNRNVPAIDLNKNILNTWEPFVEALLVKKGDTQLGVKFKSVASFLKNKDNAEMAALIHPSKFKFVVLNHGDFRKDNIMLKYNLSGKVNGVKLLDFQTSFWSNPVHDIFYFFMTSVSIDVVEMHYDALVDKYLENLNKKLRKLSCQRLYEKKDFVEDVGSMGYYLVTCVLCLCCVFCPVDHAQRKKTFTQQSKDNDQLYEACLNDEKFSNTIYRWFKHCEKLKVFEGYEEN